MFRYPSEGTQPAPARESVEYGFKQNKDGDIIVTLDYYRGGSELTNGEHSIPIKTGPDPTQPVGPDNYAIKCSVAIQLKAADVAGGLINPSFVGKPMVSMQFTPDLGRLEQVR